jgi:hypothetical protein
MILINEGGGQDTVTIPATGVFKGANPFAPGIQSILQEGK